MLVKKIYWLKAYFLLELEPGVGEKKRLGAGASQKRTGTATLIL